MVPMITCAVNARKTIVKKKKMKQLSIIYHKYVGTAALFLALLALSCGPSKRTVAPTAQSQRLDSLVEAQRFQITVQWAQPLLTNSMAQVLNSGLMPPGSNVARIDLQGTGYFLALEGDTVSASLPYYGERQRGGGYGSSEGIVFKGPAKELQLEKEESRQSHQVNFSISEKGESFQVWLSLLPNGRATAQINSSDRFSIGYEGRWGHLPSKPGEGPKE
jgi:hypothetical protein